MKRRALPCEARPPLCHGAGDERRAVAGPHDNFCGRAQSKRLGSVFEGFALEYLQRQRLRFVARNVTCRGGEIDLVMREPDGVLVFVEVRARAGSRYGGAVASVGREKQRRIVRAAQYFLAKRGDTTSACRFDIVAYDGRRIAWLRDAFRADGFS
ncbi:MAG TPA: YraN family protein [Trinickia sp.]|uniref:YraN family protein n=1 Tax=Trinickia sp. TaxID=2571163 RepID=UPI002F40779A